MNCWPLVFLLLCFIASPVEGKNLIKKIANIVKGLTGQKFAGKAGSDLVAAAERLSNIQINSRSDVFLYSPEIKAAVSELSHAVQNAKLDVGLDRNTIAHLKEFENMLSDFSIHFHESVKDVSDAAKTVGLNFEKGMENAVLLANVGVMEALDKMEDMGDSYFKKFDDWGDELRDSFLEGMTDHGSKAALTLKECIILFNNTVVCVLMAWMLLHPPVDFQKGMRWFLFVALFGCLALLLTGADFSGFSLSGDIATAKVFPPSVTHSPPAGNNADLSPLHEQIIYLETELKRRLDNLETNLKDTRNDVVHLETGSKTRLDNLETGLTETGNNVVQLKIDQQSTSTALTSLEDKHRITTNILMLASNPLPIFPLLDDSAFGASTHHPALTPDSSRIHKPRKLGDAHRNQICWHRGDNSGEFNHLQVDLGQLYYITEIQTRGRYDHNQFITSYKIGYVHPSLNVETTLMNLDGRSDFDGGYSGTAVYSNKYFKPFISRYVKLYITGYAENQCTNWEILGVAMSDIELSVDSTVNHIKALGP